MPEPQAGEQDLVKDEARSVSSLIQRIQGRGAASTILILDACRDNPFAVRRHEEHWRRSRSDARRRADRRLRPLLGRHRPDGARFALERDPNPNSVFTRKLLPLLETPGLTQVQLAKELQEQVSSLAATVHHQQQPAYYDQIIGDIVLKPKPEEVAAPASAPAPAVPPRSKAAEAWLAIEGTASPGVLNAFIANFPDSVYADFARARLKELEAPPPEPRSAASPPTPETPAPGRRRQRAARDGPRAT